MGATDTPSLREQDRVFKAVRIWRIAQSPSTHMRVPITGFLRYSSGTCQKSGSKPSMSEPRCAAYGPFWTEKSRRAELMDLLIPLAEIKGLERVLEEQHPRPGVFVANRDTPVPDLQAFIRAWNKAVDVINDQPETYQQKATREFIEQLPPELQVSERDLMDKLEFPHYSHIRRYSREEFTDTYTWMVTNDLIQAGKCYEDAVITEVQ